jgi:predicted PurR-regulated permease PerM
MADEKSFAQRALIVVVLAITAILLLTLFYYVFDILLIIFMAVLVAVFLRGSATFLAKYTKMSEGLQVGLIVLVLLIVGIIGLIFLAPDVFRQLDELGEGIPTSIAKLKASIEAYPQGIAILSKIPDPAAIWERVVASGALKRVAGMFSSTLGAVGNLFVILMLAGYFAGTPGYYSQGIQRLFPIAKRERVREILETIYNSLFFWLMGKNGFNDLYWNPYLCSFMASWRPPSSGPRLDSWTPFLHTKLRPHHCRNSSRSDRVR